MISCALTNSRTIPGNAFFGFRINRVPPRSNVPDETNGVSGTVLEIMSHSRNINVSPQMMCPLPMRAEPMQLRVPPSMSNSSVECRSPYTLVEQSFNCVCDTDTSRPDTSILVDCAVIDPCTIKFDSEFGRR